MNEKPYLITKIQNGSLNGSDGCCGDDIPSCYNPTLHTPCLYTDEQSCISNPLCRWRGESVNAFGFDYGYIGPSSTNNICVIIIFQIRIEEILIKKQLWIGLG